ncbi:transducin-like enhancer protein 6 isoform X7 [Ursus arctos]|uniref:transducin-like enhancer protein 6 isoform X7 n=1 Tax=Ursus arctos TaxID=9644 RepID=UPI00201730C5|nr:transducin-like enhancer protein 6 isoform X7 [Ursus arctos]
MTSWGHLSPRKHPPRMRRPPGTPAPSELNYWGVLDQLRQEFPRFPPHLAAQVESVYSEIQKLRQGLQEHHQQAENFLRTMETWSRPLGFPPGEADPDSWAPASPEASPHPAAKTPQPSGLRGPPFEDVLAARSSDWLRQLSRANAAPVPQPDTQPSWDSEPRFWQGVLTEQLWQIFAGTHKKDQPRRRTTGQSPGPESQDPGPHALGLEPHSEDTLVPSPLVPSPSSPEGSQEGSTEPGPEAEGMLSPSVAQEPAGRASPFLKPICWDPEDFEDMWKRPDALPWQSKKAAIPHGAEKTWTLKHGEPVLATAVSSFTRHAFTCGRGGVKVWSLVGQGLEDRYPESHLSVQHDPADGRPQPGQRERVGPDCALPAHEPRAALCRPHMPGPGLRPRGHPGLRWLHGRHSQGLGPAGPESCQGPAGPPEWSQEHCYQRPEHLDGGTGHLPAVLGPEEPWEAPGIPIRVSDNEPVPESPGGLGAGGHSQWPTVAAVHPRGPEAHGGL